MVRIRISEVTFVRNAHGCKVKKCCASCAFKYYIEGQRLCSMCNEPVDALDQCDEWQMSDGLRNAGKGTGVVRHYVTKEIIIK